MASNYKYHPNAITPITKLFVCGYNFVGQLGTGNTTSISTPVQTVAGGTNWRQIAVGRYHTSAVKTDGTLWTWGYNLTGQLGDNTTTNKSTPAQIVDADARWLMCDCGSGHTSAIKNDGTLWSWGDNSLGQLGNNTITNKSSPIQTIAGGGDWKQVASSYQTTLAIKTDGTLWGFGANGGGQLGDNTAVHKSSPVQTVAGGTNWKQVTLSVSSAAAIKTDGTLWTWGTNSSGQLGDNTTAGARYSPIQTVSGGTNWKQVVGCRDSIAAIKTDGTLWTWGHNVYGTLGDNTIVAKSSPVQTVAGGTNWLSLIKNDNTEQYNVGATKTDGTLWAWGSNTKGDLGDGTSIHKSSPVQILSIGANWSSDMVMAVGRYIQGTVQPTTDFDDVFVKRDIFSQGGLWLWGNNGLGNLGDNTITNKSSPVQTVTGGTNWKQVAIGGYHSSAIKTDGTLWLWGYNSDGELGDNTAISKSSPVQTVAGGTNWKQVAASGLYHTTAIKTDGTLWLWGMDNYGQLGDNSISPKSSPVQTICGGNNWKQVSCGNNHTTAIKTDGTLWTWGMDNYGQLGDNSISPKSSPVQTVAGGTNWASVAGGGVYHTVAIKTDGTLWTWGYNTNGQLGDNTDLSKSSPIQTVAGGTNWKYTTCGHYHTAAIKTDGTLWTWGNDGYGQLGDNTSIPKSSPVQTIAGGNTWTHIACGGGVVAAIRV